MALLLTDSVLPRSGAAAPFPITYPPVQDTGGLLERTVRLSTLLLGAPSARIYLTSTAGPQIVAAFGSAADAPLDDRGARATAREVLRTGTMVRRPARAPRSRASFTKAPNEEAASHLGVPLLLGGPSAAAVLVVSDLPGRAWAEVEAANLTDLAAITTAGMQFSMDVGDPFGGGVPMGKARSGARGATPRQPGRRSLTAVGPSPSTLFADAGDDALAQIIRQSILGSLHLGALHAGDRLPSIRQTARAFSVTPYLVLQAYAELELEGLVERRERSGIFVAEFEVSREPSLPETGAWLTEVLTQACQHQVKIPLLPDLIRRWTTAVPIRCACIESCHDSRFALTHELSQQFGINSYAVSPAMGDIDIEEADLVITTAYHAADVGPAVTAAGKPMLIATINPLILTSALSHLRERDLTVICVDPEYGERLRALHGGVYRERVRVVTTADEETLNSLDRTEAVLLTPAARQRLPRPDFRLVAPMFPSYSLEFARKVAEALVRINLHGARA